MSQPAKKPPRDADIFIGGAQSAFGAFLAVAAISGLSALFTLGSGGLVAAMMAVPYIAGTGGGIYLFVKGAVKMGKGFTEAGKTPAEVRFEENPEAFTLQPLTQEFDLKAKRAVKVMRPLKLGARSAPQP